MTMAETEPCVCRCGTRVPLGVLFCFKHAATPPKIGELSEEGGQLRWTTTREVTGARERFLAVLVDDEQVIVEIAREAPMHRPVRIDLEVRPPGSPEARPRSVSVSIADVFDAIQARREVVQAKPSARP
jgi:hypothetical protein